MDYIPKRDGDLLLWLENYKTKIALVGASFGMTATEIGDEQAECDKMIEAINTVKQAKDAFAAAVAARDAMFQQAVGMLRTNIGRHKKAIGFTDTIAQDLGVVGSSSVLNPTTYKASITAEIFGGFVRIKFKKLGADGVNIYHRKKGSATWLFLARDTRSPYDDHIQLTTPNQPEHWEYMAYGVLDDEQIGLQSDIVEVVFGG